MDNGNIPPIPGQAPDEGGRGQYVTPGSAPLQPIYVNVPPQKSSKAPWIILAVICTLLFGFIFGSMYSCSHLLTSSMTGLSGVTGATATAPATSGDTVAVVHLNSTIAGSGSGYITPEVVYTEIQDAEADPNVKAIVLRIDSGGGSAAASEEISAYIANCSKPVVVSIGDICASGAYMAASQSDYIYTMDGATVGSIGVIMTMYNIEELLDKLGISVESITSGEDKDAGAFYNSLTDDQRAALQEEVDLLNAHFIDMVAQGRGLDRDKVAQIATGRTWTGGQAMELGLVDEIGTYEDALDKAAELGGISGDYDAVSFDMATSTLGQLGSLL